MNDLRLTYPFLADSLLGDPVLSLAYTVVALDPFWCDAEEDDLSQDGDDTLTLALRIVRCAFPEIYIEGVQQLRAGASYSTLDRLICTAITQRGIPLESLEFISFGIPMPAYGAVLDDPDFYTAHPDVLPVLDLFGIRPDPNPYTIDVPECAYTAGKLIAADLEKHEDERYRQIGALMQWLFSCSGNSSVDFGDESMAEFQPLSWETEEIAFAVDIIEEAEGIMADAMAGLAFLISQHEMMDGLQDNIRQIYKALKSQKEKPKPINMSMSWPLF